MPVSQAPSHNVIPASEPGLAVEEPITVWLLDEVNCPPYTRFVRRHPDGSLYHTLAWRDALAASDVGRPCYLAAMRADRVVGAMPLFERQEPGGPRTLVSLPATPGAGTLTAEDPVRERLWNRALHLARKRNIRRFVIRRFSPADEADLDAASSTAFRVPLQALLDADDDERAERFCRLPLTAETLSHLSTPEDQTPRARNCAVLQHLQQAGHICECAALLDEGDDVTGVVVWVRFERHAHVLACGPATAPDHVHRALLKLAAREAGRGGARWIDFPSHSNAAARLVRSLDCADVQVACERDVQLA
jgi:hypothetical protein